MTTMTAAALLAAAGATTAGTMATAAGVSDTADEMDEWRWAMERHTRTSDVNRGAGRDA